MHLQVSDETSRQIAQGHKGPFLGVIIHSAEADRAKRQLHVLNIAIVDDINVLLPSGDGYVQFSHKDVIAAFHRHGLLSKKRPLPALIWEKITGRGSDCGCGK